MECFQNDYFYLSNISALTDSGFLTYERVKKAILLIGFLLIISLNAVYATHIRAGEITVRRVGCVGTTYEFVLTAYRDTGSDILFGNGIFDFGDGESIALNPDDYFRKEIIEEEVELVQFRIRHSYEGPNTYTVSYFEEFRNVGIFNINQSGTVPFFVTTTFKLDPFFGCNDSPVFLIPPVDKGAVGLEYFHNPGAFDVNGDSISFRMTVPLSNDGVQAPGFQSPEIAAGGMNRDQTGPATLTLDEITGDLIWDAPGAKGEFNVAFIAEEWRKIEGNWEFLGSVTRDMQIIIEETDNEPPELEIPNDTCIEAGTLLEAEIFATDPDVGSKVRIEGYGGSFVLSPPSTLSPDPPVYSEIPTTAQFSWQTSCDHIREDPYQIRFKATDNGPGVRLTAFETWNVTVVPPSPKNVEISPEPNRSLELTWDPYDCGLAEVIQVYRRVDSFAFEPENCEIGIPENGGYALIGSVPVSTSRFLDTNSGQGLDFGATYCYRLVAVFELPQGGVSYASTEVCEEIAATAPLITNVTVDETSDASGQITVSWLPPFDIDTSDYPPPYKYDLLRAVGDGDFQSIAVIEDDTTFTDTGLNTLEEQYNYRLGLYLDEDEVNDENLIEISSPASSVWLNSVSLFQAVELSWDADVPWSNTNQDYPYHYIYRDKVGSLSNTDLVLIDSVDVTQTGYIYLDSGAFNGQELSNDEIYCYYITTSGTYGNEDVFDPLLNNSQVLCVQPSDMLAPCPPFSVNFELDTEDACLNFLADKPCEFDQFENSFSWTANLLDSCDSDIRYYEIFFSESGLEEDFEMIATINDTTYRHSGLTSFKGCYRIRAVDRSENRSEFSETFCRDNCPNIAFPNVITPNGDGKNEVFTPYYPGGSADGNIPLELCPRFVQSLEFRVFNRYGKEVYYYQSGGENSVYINWNGTNASGQELPSAVYYYEVNVTFDLLDPDNTRMYKGWVQVIN